MTRRRKAVFAGAMVLLAVVVGYGAWAAVRTRALYRQLKVPGGTAREVYRADAQLGWAPVPESTGEHVYPDGKVVATRFDEDGLRIPLGGAPSLRERPRILALGCSFTYGERCAAEEAYPYLVARAVHGSALNAGIAGYGLSQMVVRARELIPRLHPDVVLAQYSSWLVDRSLATAHPMSGVSVPTPFFTEDERGAVTIAPPAFLSVVFDVRPSRFREQGAGALDYLSFCATVSIPVAAHDDAARASGALRRALGRAPSPLRADARASVVRAAYREIAELSRAHGARLVIVRLSLPPPFARRFPEADEAELAAFVRDSHCGDVDTEPALTAQLPERSAEAWFRAYGHWSGAPAVLCDVHPNSAAHRAIAEVVASALR